MFNNKKTVVGLDIGSTAAKMVTMSFFKGRRVITHAEIVEFTSERQEDRRQALKEGLKGLEAKRCVAGVSGRAVCVRYLPVKAGSPEALQAAIAYEADEVIPFELNEVYLDGQNITPFEGLGPDAEIDAVLVAAKKSRVDELIGEIKELGLVPQIIDVECFALGNLHALQDLGDGMPAALIDVGAFKSGINIVKDGVSRFSREVYLGSNDFKQALVDKIGLDETEADKILRGAAEHEETEHQIGPVVEELASELGLALEFFEDRSPEPVGQVLVTGGGSRALGLMDRLSMQFGRPVTPWNPFENIECEGLDSDELGMNRSRFAVAVGLAARVGEGA